MITEDRLSCRQSAVAWATVRQAGKSFSSNENVRLLAAEHGADGHLYNYISGGRTWPGPTGAPTPDTADLAAVAERLEDVIGASDPKQANALLRPLIKELRVNSRREIRPTDRVVDVALERDVDPELDRRLRGLRILAEVLQALDDAGAKRLQRPLQLVGRLDRLLGGVARSGRLRDRAAAARYGGRLITSSDLQLVAGTGGADTLVT